MSSGVVGSGCGAAGGFGALSDGGGASEPMCCFGGGDDDAGGSSACAWRSMSAFCLARSSLLPHAASDASTSASAIQTGFMLRSILEA